MSPPLDHEGYTMDIIDWRFVAWLLALLLAVSVAANLAVWIVLS